MTAPRPDTPAAAAPAKKVRTLSLYSSVEALDILDEIIAEHAEAIKARGGDIESIPEIAELLAFAEDGWQEAILNLAKKKKQLDAEAMGAELEANRLNAIVAQKKNAATKLKEFIQRQMEVRGVAKIPHAIVPLRIQSNSAPSVTAVSEVRIEELYAQGSEFIRRREEFDLNREAILEAHKNGVELPEGILVKKGQHLRIG